MEKFTLEVQRKQITENISISAPFSEFAKEIISILEETASVKKTNCQVKTNDTRPEN